MIQALLSSPRGRYGVVELREPAFSAGMWSVEAHVFAKALIELRCGLDRVHTDTTFQVRDRNGYAIATFYKE